MQRRTFIKRVEVGEVNAASVTTNWNNVARYIEIFPVLQPAWLGVGRPFVFAVENVVRASIVVQTFRLFRDFGRKSNWKHAKLKSNFVTVLKTRKKTT